MGAGWGDPSPPPHSRRRTLGAFCQYFRGIRILIPLHLRRTYRLCTREWLFPRSEWKRSFSVPGAPCVASKIQREGRGTGWVDDSFKFFLPSFLFLFLPLSLSFFPSLSLSPPFFPSFLPSFFLLLFWPKQGRWLASQRE